MQVFFITGGKPGPGLEPSGGACVSITKEERSDLQSLIDMMVARRKDLWEAQERANAATSKLEVFVFTLENPQAI